MEYLSGITTIKVQSQYALETIEQFKTSHQELPIILGHQEDLIEFAEHRQLAKETYESVLLKATAISPNTWFEQRLREDPEYYTVNIGEWPSEREPIQSLEVLRHPKQEVYIALFPLQTCWMVPAFLHFGGWNECPFPEEHTAIWKYWQERYDAQVIAITKDTVEMTVARPPQTREQAMELAREQFLYCADIVHQGTQTLSVLASTLLHGKSWFFWWD